MHKASREARGDQMVKRTIRFLLFSTYIVLEMKFYPFSLMKIENLYRGNFEGAPLLCDHYLPCYTQRGPTTTTTNTHTPPKKKGKNQPTSLSHIVLNISRYISISSEIPIFYQNNMLSVKFYRISFWTNMGRYIGRYLR